MTKATTGSEVRAYVKINGTEEVFTVSAGLYSKENVEQYQLGFGGTLENCIWKCKLGR